SQECVFLGYSSTYKGYKCLSPEGHVYVSKDVLFNEQRFPYPSLFSSTKVNNSNPTPTVYTSPSHVPLHLPTQNINPPTQHQDIPTHNQDIPTQPPVLCPVPLTTVYNTPGPPSPLTPPSTSSSFNSVTSSPPIQTSNASQHIFYPSSTDESVHVSPPPSSPPLPTKNLMSLITCSQDPKLKITPPSL
ncbi:hypothetical protein A2U01_0019998, partial [Trifolium medium]|nr:hypothetical protein [Trifolium medium]